MRLCNLPLASICTLPYTAHMEKSKQNFVGTEYSSGDSKMIKSKQKYTEENNNEVDELTKDFSEMGCIVNPDKQPSNICIETCVYESEDEDQNEKDEDGYSDEFEEDKSEEEELQLEPVSLKRNNETNGQRVLPIKLTNSRSSMSSKPPATISGRSTSSSSQFVPTTRRVNMSFSNERLREIERHNHILLGKILTARNSARSSIPRAAPARPRRAPPAALLRKQAQKKIDHDNLILLKKIQRARPAAGAGAGAGAGARAGAGGGARR